MSTYSFQHTTKTISFYIISKLQTKPMTKKATTTKTASMDALSFGSHNETVNQGKKTAYEQKLGVCVCLYECICMHLPFLSLSFSSLHPHSLRNIDKMCTHKNHFTTRQKKKVAGFHCCYKMPYGSVICCLSHTLFTVHSYRSCVKWLGVWIFIHNIHACWNCNNNALHGVALEPTYMHTIHSLTLASPKCVEHVWRVLGVCVWKKERNKERKKEWHGKRKRALLNNP